MGQQIKLGSVRIVAIEDGFWTRNPQQFFARFDPAQLEEGQLTYQSDGSVRFPFGCFLVDGPAGLALIDSGGGPDHLSSDEMTTGALPGELAALGVDPADIQAVVHTHLHPDHWAGDVTESGEAAFANAAIFLHPDELEHYRSDPRIEERFLPLVDRGHVETVPDGTKVWPGLTVHHTMGHTPGHFSVEIDCGDVEALVLGDVAHHPLQLDHPDWSAAFDWDGEVAAATRDAVFDKVVTEEMVMVGGHFSEGHFGRVRLSSGRRRWEPIEA